MIGKRDHDPVDPLWTPWCRSLFSCIVLSVHTGSICLCHHSVVHAKPHVHRLDGSSDHGGIVGDLARPEESCHGRHTYIYIGRRGGDVELKETDVLAARAIRYGTVLEEHLTQGTTETTPRPRTHCTHRHVGPRLHRMLPSPLPADDDAKFSQFSARARRNWRIRIRRKSPATAVK